MGKITTTHQQIKGNRPRSQLEDQAEFTTPIEQLAYPIIVEGEANLPEIWSEPLPIIVQVYLRVHQGIWK